MRCYLLSRFVLDNIPSYPLIYREDVKKLKTKNKMSQSNKDGPFGKL
jgi:hypothetical protein